MNPLAVSIQRFSLVLFSVLCGIGVSLGADFNSIDILASISAIVLLPILTYLCIFQYRYFMAFVVFVFPLSLSYDFSGNVISFPSEAFLIVLTILFVLRMLFIGLPSRRFLLNPITILLLADLLWTLITSLSSSMVEVSMKRFIMKAMFMAVFYFSWATLFKSPKNVRLFFLAYSLGLIIPIINTLINHSVHYFLMRAAFFATEPFYAEHTVYAACLTFVLLGLLAILFYFRRELSLFKRLAIIGLIALFFLADFLAFSRAAWLSFVAAVGIWVFLQLRLRRYVLISIGVLGVIILSINYQMIVDSFQSNRAVSSNEDIEEHLQSITSISGDVSNAERLNRWVSAWEMFKERPLTGFGPGTYQFQYGAFQKPEYLTRISTFEGERGNAHSEYLNVLSESGIMGLIILLFLLYHVFRKGIQVYWNSHDKSQQIVALIAVVCLVSYYAHGVVNCFIDIDKASILVYSAMAMIAMAYHKFTEDQNT